jgi:hypothetical protein
MFERNTGGRQALRFLHRDSSSRPCQRSSIVRHSAVSTQPSATQEFTAKDAKLAHKANFFGFLLRDLCGELSSG